MKDPRPTTTSHVLREEGSQALREAAPEMYKLLRSMGHECNCSPPTPEDCIGPTLGCRVSRLIAKVEGRS